MNSIGDKYDLNRCEAIYSLPGTFRGNVHRFPEESSICLLILNAALDKGHDVFLWHIKTLLPFLKIPKSWILKQT